MKKILAFISATLLIFTLSGCNVIPKEQISETNNDKETIEVWENTVSYSDISTYIPSIEIQNEDAKAIGEILENNDWIPETPDCMYNCTLNLRGRLYNYHSTCGTFTEVVISKVVIFSKDKPESSTKSLKLSEKQRDYVNSILNKYVPISGYEGINCSTNTADENSQITEQKENNNMKEISNISTFTDKLYTLMPENTNYMYSPLSIKMAFALAANGANGKTENEIENALEIGDLDDYNESTMKLIDKYSSNEVIKLNIANSVWINSTTSPYVFDKEYISDVNKYFHAEARTTNAENAVSEVNAWTNDKTGGKIPKVIDNADFDALLLNSIYFKATWQNQFEDYLTKNDVFTNRDGNKVSVPFMNITDYFQYSEKDGIKIIELPYSTSISKYDENDNYIGTETMQNTNVSMFILLSDKNITEPEKTVNALYNNKKLDRTYIKLSLPKFKIEYETKLVDIMKKLGIVTAFDSTSADFTDMFENGNMYISDAIHKTFIEVDENGTEAAAVTALAVKAMGMPAPNPEPVEFKADKPFTFIIRDNISGETLFIGEYAFAK